MTREDLYDWVMTHGCEQIVLPEIKARVIRFVNPKNQQTAHLSLPIDDRKVKDNQAYQICSSLGIEVPTHCNYMSKINKFLKGGA